MMMMMMMMMIISNHEIKNSTNICHHIHFVYMYRLYHTIQENVISPQTKGPGWLNELGSCRGPGWLNELGSWIT
jgi:hypothetical protein